MEIDLALLADAATIASGKLNILVSRQTWLCWPMRPRSTHREN